ncbi:hypothetical protein CRG98_040909 [Punica granatum]|uniref:Uncharacterized protein n=1 Tax=Punica granatum TaxID=22663 RepID=A0A2I0I414_PUNGR|nr:hypothetical protein CRG98_040909 [Punica granatum]
MAGEGTANCIDIILAIILPPLGVFLKFGCKVVRRFGGMNEGRLIVWALMFPIV